MSRRVMKVMVVTNFQMLTQSLPSVFFSLTLP